MPLSFTAPRSWPPAPRSAIPGQVGQLRSLIEGWLAPRPRVDPRWTAHETISGLTVDHAEWGAFLGRYRLVDTADVARVAYGEVSPPDRERLAAYLRALENTPISRLNRGEQLAYWVNLYNAATVRLVLEHYPVGSIQEIGPRLAFGPWRLEVARVEGHALSLAHIENRIIRAIWRDPRVHYVLNCASVGCPNLPAKPMTGSGGETLLQEAQSAFMRSRRGARVENGRAFLSSIYNWFVVDFGGRVAITELFRAYGTPTVTDTLVSQGRAAGYFYDWGLNAAV